MKEASFQEPAGGGRVSCFLCSRRCIVAEGRAGACGVRWNSGGKLFTAAYGRVISHNARDPIEKKPLYHFLPGTRCYSVATVGCNFMCSFCQNWQISQVRPGVPDLPGEDLGPEEAASEAQLNGCSSVAYTYTEPTIFMEYALDIASAAKRRGLANVFVTNGYMTPEAVAGMKGLVDAANVDLKAFSDSFYRDKCRASLQPVLDSITALHAAGIHVEITTLVIPGANDSDAELREAASFIASLSPDIPWHVSRFHPDFEDTSTPATPVETVARAARIGKEQGLRYVYVGNAPGFDQDTRCHWCGRVVVRRAYMGVRGMDLEGGKCPDCGASIPIVLEVLR